MTDTATADSAEAAAESGDLPEGWSSVELRRLIEPSNEKVEPEASPNAPYLSLEHIEAHTGRILGHGVGSDVRSTKAVFRAGDVLYGKLRPYLNKVCIPNFDGICSTDILVFPQNDVLDSRYLRAFLSTPEVVSFANHNSSGVQLPRVSFKALGTLRLPLPPLAEQKRIVAEIDRLLAEINKAREHLDRVPKLLKRFRQSILAAATTGRLTEDWRKQCAVQPSVQAAAPQVGGPGAKRSKTPSTEPPDGLPENWFWRSIDQLLQPGRSVGYGFVKPGAHDPDGVPVLKSGCVNYRRVDLTEGSRISAKLDEQYRRTRLQGGEVLLNLVGASIGRSAVAPPEVRGWNVSRAIAVVPVEIELAEWVHLMIEGPAGQSLIQSKTGGSAQPVLNIEEVRTLGLPIPPAAERAEGVRRVKQLFAMADGLETNLNTLVSRVEKLPQAILAKAFRGELVPTEAELARTENRPYESATQLLARISSGAALPALSSAEKRAKGRPVRQGRRVSK